MTTFARWLRLFCSAMEIASSILPSFSAPATAGAKTRDCLRAQLKAIQRSIMTPIDQADMMNSTITTMRAGHAHRCATWRGGRIHRLLPRLPETTTYLNQKVCS